ncbi:hypothetical protein FlaCF_1922 [Flavobacterium tructae]
MLVPFLQVSGKENGDTLLDNSEKTSKKYYNHSF